MPVKLDFDNVDSSGSSSSSSSGSYDPANRTPTGIQNPFNWVVEDGDIIGVPESYVTPTGAIPGLETLFDSEGWNLNPVGEIRIDPSQRSYTVGESGAVPSEELDNIQQRLTSLLSERSSESEPTPTGMTGWLVAGLVGLALLVWGVTQ